MDTRLEAVLRDAVECRYRPNIDDIDAQNILHEIEFLRQQLAECERERDELISWQQSAFDAHPNIDLDIEAIAKVGAGKTNLQNINRKETMQ
jgi:hypothetical protein